MHDGVELLRHAQRRADEWRARYREGGFWSGLPLDLVRVAATRHPDRTALITRDGDSSFADLDDRVDRAARALRAAGVRAATPLVVVAGNDVESVVAIHAAARVDAVLLLVPRTAGPTHIADVVARTAGRFGVAPGWPAADLTDRCHWIDLDDATSAEPPDGPSRPADEPSIVLFTSGTTSRPKGVVHSISTLAKASANYVAAAGLDAHDRIFLISPLASVTGVLQAVFIAPMLAVPVVLENRWEPAATCDLLLTSGATWYGGPDRLLDRLLDEVTARDAEIPLRAVYLGGTMLDRRIVERVEDDFGIVVMRAYGSSEVPVSTSGLRTEPRNTRHGDDGVPLQDVEVRVAGADGECQITGPHTCLGYTDAEDDAAAFDGRWFRTGDIAEVTDGRVRIVGRIKDIVIRNGLKIPAAEIDEAVANIDGVRDCAAYSVADPVTGERVAVAVVLDDGVAVSLADVAAALTSAGLPKYKLPEELVFWADPLPRNANGKVVRKNLQAGADGRPTALADRLASAG